MLKYAKTLSSDKVNHAQNQSNCEPLSDPMHALWNDSSDEQTGIFGLPFSVDESSVVLMSAPWEAACSQGLGTAQAPELILQQSRFVELHDIELGNIYERKIALAEQDSELRTLVKNAAALNSSASEYKYQIDQISNHFCQIIDKRVSQYLRAGQNVGLLGGDHSVIQGSVTAHHRMFPQIGILQIDAHSDLRPALDGLTRSHASVMYNVMEELNPVSLTQVGIRALCSVERDYIEKNRNIHLFSDAAIQRWLAMGQGWLAYCELIVDSLPMDIYLTVDIDGLDPTYCPNTGTPVPGGLTFNQVLMLLKLIVKSGRKIRGFDLVEVGGNELDALIAAHLLYPLCGLVGDIAISHH